MPTSTVKKSSSSATKKSPRPSLFSKGLRQQIASAGSIGENVEPDMVENNNVKTELEETPKTESQSSAAPDPLNTPEIAPEHEITSKAIEPLTTDDRESVKEVLEVIIEDISPYSFMKKTKGPLLNFKAPFLFPESEDHKNAVATINFRVPINLKDTIEEHCFATKTNQSEWLRRAVQFLLTAEQEAIEKLK